MAIIFEQPLFKMTRIYFILTLSLFSLTLSSCGQTKADRLKSGETYARKELKVALSDSAIHNVISAKSLIIKDKETAVNVAEPILFDTYGKGNIRKQRPYEIYLVDNFWVISGTLPKGYSGGTFLIIIDATNSKIIRLTHSK
jgi:hypothetical protein